MERLSSFFDFKFDQLNVRYLSNKHPSGADVFGTDSESLLNLGCPGVILLLGKNGSGKSRFLKSLGSYARHSAWSPSVRSSRQPEISFRYSVPTIEENYDYLETRKNLSNDPEFSEMKDFLVLQNYKNDRLNLFFHDALISTICTRALNLLVLDNFGLEPKALLEHFGFSEPEIVEFEKRIKKHEVEFEYHPEWDQLERPRENLNFRDYFVEFFLTLLSYSTLHKVPWDVGPGSWFDCRKYLSDKDELVRLVSALRELFENTTHVEIRGDGENMWLSLIDQNVPGPELEQVLNSFKDLSKKYENQTFPFDLLRVEESFAATAFLPLSIGTHSGWHPLDVVDATFVSREKSFDGLNEIFRGFLKLKVIQKDLTHYQVDVSGLEAVETLLRQVEKLLLNVDIGVSKIELQEANHTWNLEEENLVLWGDSRKHDFTPIVGWQDSITKKWLPLDVCSDGQLEVIRILVNLCKLTGSDSTSAVKFLLIDEFDRHLNPVIAQQTLNLIDRYAKKFNTYVLLSTHTIGSLDVYKHNQIFASRDAAGLFNLSMNRTGDQLFLADQLGIPERDMSRFSKLFVVVEGDHEELIFNDLFATNNLVDYEIVNLVGLKQARGKWRSELQYENADVLVVYDNRSEELEKKWSNLQKARSKAQFAEKLFEKSGFKKMRLEAHSRLNRREGLPGDIEMNYLGFLLEEILDKTDNQQKNIKRLHLHGMEVSDIVDCLPIKEFPMASKAAKSWEELHKENIKMHGPEFKKKFDINNKTVEKAVKSKNFNEPIHPELQRLWDRILGLTEARPNWM